MFRSADEKRDAAYAELQDYANKNQPGKSTIWDTISGEGHQNLQVLQFNDSIQNSCASIDKQYALDRDVELKKDPNYFANSLSSTTFGNNSSSLFNSSSSLFGNSGSIFSSSSSNSILGTQQDSWLLSKPFGK